ncbi:MAG: S8 family serine peptidase [Rudaea sp.]|uniref:S8 family serine peptidase n=1 Tax=unclassified Rudaea TaxID=2627037 RepID=UPI0010F47B08|nr:MULTISPECIES: S8 family serine peptidase [unclassified Rudaea]MBN8884907.1 S8 family serine peptidase [Rudaea sp.]
MILQSHAETSVCTSSAAPANPLRRNAVRKTALAAASLLYVAGYGSLFAQMTPPLLSSLAEAEAAGAVQNPAAAEFEQLLKRLDPNQADAMRGLIGPDLAAAAAGPSAPASAIPGRREYLVVLAGDSVATTLRASRDSVAAQAPMLARSLGPIGDRLDPQSTDSLRLVAQQRASQSQVAARAAAAIGRSLPVERNYHYALNGMLLRLTDAEALKLRGVDGVSKVIRPTYGKLTTDVSVPYIGAPELWNAPAPFGTRGEHTIVGVLDTGANLGSPSFADIEWETNGAWSIPSYHFTNPLGAGNYRGWCAPGRATQDKCNNKLIGTYDYAYPYVLANPKQFPPPISELPGVTDQNGHGSHTASTAVGDSRLASYFGNRTMTGVAPHANLEIFQVCASATQCGGQMMIDAVEQAILDGIDALNYSIGPAGGDKTDSPWDSSEMLAFLSAVDAGIFVAAAAGNDGPGTGTVSNTAPWVATVAATTSPRDSIGNYLSVNGRGAGKPDDMPLHTSSGPMRNYPWNGLKLKVSPTFASGGDCGPYPTDYFKGTVALIDMGYTSAGATAHGCETYSDGVVSAVAAGAVAVVGTNNLNGAFNLDLGGPSVPASLVARSAAVQLAAFAAAQPEGLAQVNFSAGIDLPTRADQITWFSSRGPTLSNETLKPDIAAPGWNILAAYRGAPGRVAMISGTSMATPHITGVGALLKSAHPDWSPAEIKSAMMLTAKDDGLALMQTDGTIGGGATPLEQGAGRVQVDLAAKSGLVMHESGLNYLQADPANGGDPTALNVPSLYSSSCFPGCTFKRRFKNALETPQQWNTSIALPGSKGATVSPASFTVAPGRSAEVVFTIDNSSAQTAAFSTGRVTLTSADRSSQTLHLPIAVRRAPPLASVSPASLAVTVKSGVSTQTSLQIAAAPKRLPVHWTYQTTGRADVPLAGDNSYVDERTTPEMDSSVYDDGGNSYLAQRVTMPTWMPPDSPPTAFSSYGRPLQSDGSDAMDSVMGMGSIVYADAGGKPGEVLDRCGLDFRKLFPGREELARSLLLKLLRPKILNYVNTPGYCSAPKPYKFEAGKSYWISSYLMFAGKRGDNGGAHMLWLGSELSAGAPIMTAGADGNWRAISPVSTPSGTALGSAAVYMSVNLPCGPSWLSPAAADGTVPAGLSQTLGLTIDASALAPGKYAGAVCIESNTPDSALRNPTTLHRVPIFLTVE